MQDVEEKKKVRIGKLNTLAQMGNEVKRLFRDGRRGVIATADAQRLANVLKVAIEAHRLGEIEPRLAQLEAQASEPATVVTQIDSRPVMLDGRRVN